MMRLWVQSYTKAAPVVTSATLSIVAHALVIAAWVYTTLPPPDLEVKSFENKPYYIPPPDRSPGQRPTRETVHYVDLTRPGFGVGDGPRQMGNLRPTVMPSESVGRMRADSVTSRAQAPVPGPQDSVFSVLDVDSAVVRSGASAAPAYPLKLLEKHIEGYVAAQYVVDTTGFADTSSFHVIHATNAEFVTAVREALPYMRFRPAKIGPSKVRQLVEQMFSFKITDTGTVAAKRKP